MRLFSSKVVLEWFAASINVMQHVYLPISVSGAQYKVQACNFCGKTQTPNAYYSIGEMYTTNFKINVNLNVNCWTHFFVIGYY